MIQQLRRLGFYYDPDMEMYVLPERNAWISFSTTGGEFGFHSEENGVMYDNITKFTVNQLPRLVAGVKKALSL